VQAALTRAVQPDATVIVDLTRADFCGHDAIVTLVSMQGLAAQAGARLQVAAATPNARLIRQIAGARHRLDFYPDLAAALVGPRSRDTAGRHDRGGLPAQDPPGRGRRRSAGKLDSGRSDVLPASQNPPLRPPRDRA
jgi:hypothetical protein